MDNRTDDLLKIRLGVKNTTLNNNMSAEEYFQNATLRPAIKFQKELLLEAFINYAKKHKNVFYSLSTDKKLHYIENAIQRDVKFRNSLKGMIIGVFSLEEYRHYTTNSSSLNKRMMHLVIERLKDNVILLEYAEGLPKAG